MPRTYLVFDDIEGQARRKSHPAPMTATIEVQFERPPYDRSFFETFR
jgi:hypothetical protein